MLYFAFKGVQTINLEVSVLFKHLGRYLVITVTNVGYSDLEDLGEARLVDNGFPSTGYWAINTDYGGEEFDLVNEEFVVNYAGDYYISFVSNEDYIECGSFITYWAWYPPLPNVVWPELVLGLYDSNCDVLFESDNSKPARTEPTMHSRAYCFYAELDVNNELLYFTDAPSFVDPRDDNVYEIATIGNQVWMAENLRYLPSVVGPATASETDPYCYVYGYYETDVYGAMATTNYDTYGVLYNWPVAMQGEVGSTSIPKWSAEYLPRRVALAK